MKTTHRVGIRTCSDYSPFGVELDGRTVSGGYRYGFQGSEKDDEFKGEGNSSDFGARMYDSRVGRFLSIDRFQYLIAGQSSYSIASNKPIEAIDLNGDYTIFVNGYIYGKKPGPVDDLTPGYQYWRSSDSDPNEFIKAAHQYFGDGKHMFINGTGDNMLSMAQTRKIYGNYIGEKIAIQLLKKLKAAPDEINEINFVSHSMGAAVTEGIIEVLMTYPELAELIKKGEVVHFSPCDADNISISDNSLEVERTQINYTQDQTLAYADADAIKTGGYKISGVDNFGVVQSDVTKMHPRYNGDDWDFHFDSKTYKRAWEFVKKANSAVDTNPTLKGKTLLLEP